MEACHLYKVKKVVITNSIVELIYAKTEEKPRNHIFTEKNWSNPIAGDQIEAYSKSKTMAEKIGMEVTR